MLRFFGSGMRDLWSPAGLSNTSSDVGQGPQLHTRSVSRSIAVVGDSRAQSSQLSAPQVRTFHVLTSSLDNWAPPSPC